jgi:DNA-binding transcriptional MerR regulator
LGLEMKGEIPEKTYFRIGEVSRILDVQPYVIRYWESEFRSVRPVRTRSDQRLYRRRDVEELVAIKKLLYEERFTINGARKQLQRRGQQTDLPVREEEREIWKRVEEGLLEIKDMLA